MIVFCENSNLIAEQNAAQNDVVFVENQFMDLTPEEFAATYLKTRVPDAVGAAAAKGKGAVEQDSVSAPPSSGGGGGGGAFSWVTSGAVTPVKNQG